jgi:hypothetical protein
MNDLLTEYARASCWDFFVVKSSLARVNNRTTTPIMENAIITDFMSSLLAEIPNRKRTAEIKKRK